MNGHWQTEWAAVADRFGVDMEQVRRDHLISHVLAAISAGVPSTDVVFFGGTALSRTYLTASRLSEDLDLIAVAPRSQVAAPARLLEQALAGVPEIEAAYVYGSWAARFHGEPGKAPGDVDVLIIGQPPRGAVDAALGGLEGQLGREVNVTYLTPQRWADPSDPFVARVRSRPLVALDLGRPRAGMMDS